MWLMTQHEKPETYVISTGKTFSVQDFVEVALEVAGLEKDINRFVTFDQDMIRPSEVDLLVGDSTKAFNELGWKPKTTFKKLIEIMVENDLKIEHARLN
jgi:GDPmannose 4,6-dehydratase